VTMRPSTWLFKHRSVMQAVWSPGQSLLIKDCLVVDGGWLERKGTMILNLYRPPELALGDASKAGPWIEHLHCIYPADAEHITMWLAHRVQHPEIKCNHALVLGGVEGIGKDTLLEPVKHAIGPWNFHEITPRDLFGNFNNFGRSIILRINEARDLGEADRFEFHDHAKIYIAAPPDVLRVNEKHLGEYYVFNLMGVLITTNHKTDGLYLPADDRRHYVAWSSKLKKDFSDAYWDRLWGWYEKEGGFGHVAAYLREYDLSAFNPKAPPVKTAAFWEIVGANQAPEDGELADAFDELGNPACVTPKEVIAKATGLLAEALMKNRRAIPHRFERCGYVRVHNPNAEDGY